MLLKFIWLCLIFIVAGGGVLLYKQPAFRDTVFQKIPLISSAIPGLKDVKGIGTTKFSSVTGQLKSDMNEGVNQTQKQILNMKISDVVNFVNRGQKIASDFRSFQDYVKEQAEGYFSRIKK